jgi:hypothetical protein
MDTAHPDSQDIAAAIVHTLALYSLAEFETLGRMGSGLALAPRDEIRN